MGTIPILAGAGHRAKIGRAAMFAENETAPFGYHPEGVKSGDFANNPSFGLLTCMLWVGIKWIASRLASHPLLLLWGAVMYRASRKVSCWNVGTRGPYLTQVYVIASPLSSTRQCRNIPTTRAITKGFCYASKSPYSQARHAL